MRVFMLAVLCVAALNFVIAADGNEIKRESFPFMAFLYYTDETILEDGARFRRSAALISNAWLISSGDVSVAFPNKTLLARLGAIDIDQKFTLSEDEEEQEREVILILRPYNYSATEWWKTDISLLKTLLPFNITSAVATARLTSNLNPIYKKCYILVYSRHSANVTGRILMRIDVDLLLPTQEECGNYFSRETMACAVDSENNSAVVDPNFCQGNRGGPLVCDNELIGLQTYINDCKQPHLYQLFIGWRNFINCAAQQRYLTQQCADISVAIAKDPPLRTPETPKITEAVGDILLDKDIQTKITQPDTEATERSTITTKVDKPTVTSVVKLNSLETKREEKQPYVLYEEKHSTKVSAKESYFHDTTAYTTEVTITKEAVMESTKERERKHRIEAKRHLVRGEASLNLPSLSISLIVVSVLAYS